MACPLISFIYIIYDQQNVHSLLLRRKKKQLLGDNIKYFAGKEIVHLTLFEITRHFLLTNIGKFVENFGETPFHCANIAMRNGEIRLDYMGSSIVMASLTSFRCKLEDHWLIPESMSEQTSGKFPFLHIPYFVSGGISSGKHLQIFFST